MYVIINYTYFINIQNKTKNLQFKNFKLRNFSQQGLYVLFRHLNRIEIQ